VSVHKVLSDIAARHGFLTSELVVQEAADPGHELHAHFQWDDSEAGPLYRIQQASQLIRSVRVVMEREPDRPPVKVRAFISLQEIDVEDSVGRYVPVEEVVASDILRSAWFRRLAEDWKRLKAKAAGSQEFAAMVLEDLRRDTA